MIKVTIEIKEELVKKGANLIKTAHDAIERSMSLERALVDMIGFSLMEKILDKGKTEFTISPDELDENENSIYNSIVPQVCALAVFTETDKKDSKTAKGKQGKVFLRENSI